jgi:Fe(3+) dicitrate transport protein
MILNLRILFIFATVFIWQNNYIYSQEFILSGKVQDTSGNDLPDVVIYSNHINQYSISDSLGNFELIYKKPSFVKLYASGLNIIPDSITVDLALTTKIVFVVNYQSVELSEITVLNQKSIYNTRFLRSVEDFGIYEAKKSDVINLKDLVANKSNNNARQIYSKVSSINIWESDYFGLQLDIGGRGLSPNRSSNFNTRQNNYEISADPLGYPESYYTPPSQAVDQIQLVRGAGALQYGTQFGGLLNFIMKDGENSDPINLELSQSYNNHGIFNSYNSLYGGAKRLNYFLYLQHKKGDGWRENSSIKQYGFYASMNYRFSKGFRIYLEYTHMNYVSQQPGGLTDMNFYINPKLSNRNRNWFNVNWNLYSNKIEYSPLNRLKINNTIYGLIASRKSIGLLDDPTVIDNIGNRDLLDGSFDNLGIETRIQYDIPLKNNLNNTILLGSKLYRGETNFKQAIGSAGYGADFSELDTTIFSKPKSDFIFPNYNNAIFLESIIRLNKNISLVPGFRYEHIKTESNGYYTYNKKINSFEDFVEEVIRDTLSKSRRIFIYGVGLSFRNNLFTEFYANATSNYRAINFSDIQIQTKTQIVDKEIKDESGFTIDIGIRKNKQSLSKYDFSVFYTRYHNKIGDIIDDGLRVRTNIGSAQIFGAEFHFEKKLSKFINLNRIDALNFYLNGSINQGKYVEINDRQQSFVRSGNYVEENPKYNFKTGIYLLRNKMAFSLQSQFIGLQFSDAANTTESTKGIYGTIPDYYVIDFSYEYMINEYLTIHLDINNLTNNYFFTRRASAYPGPGIIPAANRTLNFTLITTL